MSAAAARVLVVDNNLADLDAVREALREAGGGAEVVEAIDAAEAIAALDAGALPDLVVVDLRLIAGSGLDVLRHLRARADGRDVPVVVVGGVLDDRDRAAAIAAGATAVAVKPRRFAEQVALARGWLALVNQREPAADEAPDPSRP